MVRSLDGLTMEKVGELDYYSFQRGLSEVDVIVADGLGTSSESYLILRSVKLPASSRSANALNIR